MNQRRIIYLIISASLLLNIAFAENIRANFDLSAPTVYQGEKTSAYLSISNEGINTINDIRITVSNPTLGLSNTVTIPKLGPGSLYTKTFDIQTLDSTDPGNYNITATVEYGAKVLTLRNALKVDVFPIQATVGVKSMSMSPGDTNTLTVNVANAGSEGIKNLYISVNAPSNFKLSGSTNVSLPLLTIGESITKNFDFKAVGTSSGDYHIIADIFFVDSKGAAHTDEVFVKVSVGSGIGIWETIAIVAILVLMVAFFIRKMV